jgi:hypothetical protein
MTAMPATTPPVGSELETHDLRPRTLRPVAAQELRLVEREPAPRTPFTTKGRVPVATTIVLFTIVGALIAFVAFRT